MNYEYTRYRKFTLHRPPTTIVLAGKRAERKTVVAEV